MDKCDRKIQVRTLSGETTTVSVSSDKSIHELKLLLKISFPPASSSPNFHLFFKGVKLNLQSQVCSLTMEPGEFIVLIPFTKKDRPQKPKPDFSEISSNAAEQTSSLKKFVDSAYTDMMQELASLREDETSKIDNNQPKSYTEFGNVSRGPLEAKRKRSVDSNSQEGRPYDFLWSVWRSKSKDALEGQNCEKFVEVLESLTCLLDPHSGKCMLLKDASMRRSNGGLWESNDNDTSCLCPAWLKKIMEAFAFLSIFCANLHLQKATVTLSRVKDALNELSKFGVRVDIEDVEHLSVLCPKVVQFAYDDMEFKNYSNAIVIISAPTEERYQVEDNLRIGHKDMSLSKIFNALKKWESSFKYDLWEVIKLLTCKIRKTAISLSLEHLLTFVKERGTVVNGNGGKRPSRNLSTASSSNATQRRCNDTSQLLPLEMVEHLRKGLGSHGQIVHVEDISPRKAVHVEIPYEISDNAKSALKCIGISKLYSHQAQSIRASLSGRNVVVATMTSSGKSLCYNLPVLEALSQNLLSCALYLFPTKALAQDQLKALLTMIEAFGASINIGIYDGDTSQKDRIWLRDNARLLITNPDMLHMSILPSHQRFSRILLNLRYVVVDEAHAYKGAFGCHTAFIFRRLRRLCCHVYGSDPSFVFSTATSANPQEHCMDLANLSTLELIKNDGSPSSQKHFVLWNPTPNARTVLNKVQSNTDDTGHTSHKNSSPISEVSYLFAEMVQHGLRCITFCKSRKLCELVLSYTREILQGTASHLVNSVCAYRAGYVAQDRRRIESDFFSGKLCGIAATNALELGIDVGHIDVTLHLGFPGSIASLWQQAGRSGRREKPSLAVYVAFGGPLDQYFMNFPQKLFNSPIECCHIDSENQQVLEQHLVCAALEHPVSLVYDEKFFGCGLNSAILTLKNKGYLSSDPSHESSAEVWSYIGHEKMPSHAISIRAIDTVKYKVIDMQKNEVLEEIEESKAFFQVYEGAVYLHQGHNYLVKELNIPDKIAFCEKANLKYYTKTRDYTDIHVVGGNIAYPSRGSKIQLLRTTAQAHICKVTTTWFGFYRLWRGSGEIFDTVDLYLPKYSYESQAVWVQVPQSVKAEVEKKFSFQSGLHAASHALLHVVPIFLRCNLSDLAPECPNPHETRYFPERILLYDQHPGGTGVSKQIQPYFSQLLTAALELLTSCLCVGDTGCPNCVQNLSCSEYNELIHKDAAIMIIKGVLDAEKSYFEGLPDSFESPTVEDN